MKKLVTSIGKFGPYNSIEVLEDRYRCDGADLPFSVVGQGEVSDVVDGDFAPITPNIEVPQTLTPQQFNRGLYRDGHYDAVMQILNSNFDYKLYFDKAIEFKRDDEVLLLLANALGFSSEQIDEKFISWSQIK